MSYVESSLAPDETVRFKARLHWILWVRAFAALVFLGVLIIGIFIFVRDLVFLTTTEVAITSRRVIRKSGLLERHTSEMELNCVEAVNLDQDLWGKALAFGRLHIHGTGDDVWVSPLIANPVQFRRELEAARWPSLEPGAIASSPSFNASALTR